MKQTAVRNDGTIGESGGTVMCATCRGHVDACAEAGRGREAQL